MPPIRARALLIATLALAGAAPAAAHDASAVLLVVNASSPDSVAVGEHYARLRGLPADHVVRLPLPVADQVTRDDYVRRLEAPLAAWFTANAAHDRILFIVLARGVPLRIEGSVGRQGTVSSVDSELALLYRRMAGRAVPAAGSVPNPYYLGERDVAEARPFARADHDIYLVTRLDGFTQADAMALADRGRAASEAAASGLPAGRVALDQRAAISDRANTWLGDAAKRLREMGLGERVLLETTSAVLRDEANLLGYYSWGSNDPSIRERALGLGFVPGAIAGQFLSSDARTFAEPPPAWKPGAPDQRASHFAGSTQSLAGDLVRQGVTGVSGHVAEPFLDAAVRPDVLFPAYLSGFTLAEAYYLAMPSLSWQAVVLGDPLAHVAPGRTPAAVETSIDPVTELPATFLARRLESATAPGVNLDALRLMLRASVRNARGDLAGARKAYEEAAALDATLVAPRLALASMLEQQGDHRAAISLYREVLAADGKNAIALNNLAFAVAVHEKSPADALPLAERAYAVSRGLPNIADTLGWVHHLLGNRTQAARYIAEAVRGERANGEIRLHLAAVLAEAGDVAGARRELDVALKLDPTLEQRQAELVAQVRAKGKP